MINFENSSLGELIVHKIGNKAEEEGIRYSNNILDLQGGMIEDILMKFFVSPFKNENLYQFFHDADDLNLNEVYYYASEIFENPDNLIMQSHNLAKHLYEQSNHPKIKAGEFYVVIIKDCLIEDEIVDAIGLFKTEKKDTFLQVKEKEEAYEIDYQDGININKLDKGCLIFNTEKENGYLVSLVDNINKSKEAQYWKDDFMKIKPRKDDYFHTQNYLDMCKTFVEKGTENLEKDEQAELKNETMKYFAENESFDMQDFEQEVIEKPEMVEAFREYKETYEEEKEVEIADNFEIADQAVKSAKRKFKSVIKLDKNFHIYVHGKKEFIKKGFDDEMNKNFYQLFFDEEK